MIAKSMQMGGTQPPWVPTYDTTELFYTSRRVLAESGIAVVQIMQEQGLMQDHSGDDLQMLRALSQHSKHFCTTLACLITGKWFVTRVKEEKRGLVLEHILQGYNPIQERAEAVAERIELEIAQAFVQTYVSSMQNAWTQTNDLSAFYQKLFVTLNNTMKYQPGTEDGRFDDNDLLDE